MGGIQAVPLRLVQFRCRLGGCKAILIARGRLTSLKVSRTQMISDGGKILFVQANSNFDMVQAASDKEPRRNG